MRHRRAILLFLRTPELEMAEKPLPQGMGRDAYRALNRRMALRARRWAVALGADLIATDGTDLPVDATIEQRGGTFGWRLSNAVTDCRDLGYRHVVVIGNDCPEINRGDLDHAFHVLAAGATTVAAPALDGGAWLIGVDAGRFDREGFASMPWCSRHLFASLRALPGTAVVGPLRRDHDNWRTRPASHALARFIGASTAQAPAAVRSYTPAPRLHKALSRPSLPAPPVTA